MADAETERNTQNPWDSLAKQRAEDLATTGRWLYETVGRQPPAQTIRYGLMPTASL